MSGAWRKKERKKEHIGYIIQLSQVVRPDFFFLNQEIHPFKQHVHTHKCTHTHTHTRARARNVSILVIWVVHMNMASR